MLIWVFTFNLKYITYNIVVINLTTWTKTNQKLPNVACWATLMAGSSQQRLVTHKGSCHCGKVQWEADAPEDLIVWKCNCSICVVKGNDHFIVPSSRFRLLSVRY